MNNSEISLDPSSISLLPTMNPTRSTLPVIHDKPITDLALKTPISFLQEICFRIHATPIYSLCPSEAQCTSSEPAFLYRVVVDDMIAFGKGSSKKRAKHKAAWLMIEECYAKLKMTNDPLIETIEQYFTLKPLHSTNANDEPTGDADKSNPIGKLQELTQKNWIRPPEYEFSDQENIMLTNNNAKMYGCRAKVATYIAEGTGLSKKIAKRQAATNLLTILENLEPEEKKALLNRAEGQPEGDSTQSHSKYRRSRRKGNNTSILDTSGVRGSDSARQSRPYEKSSFQIMKTSDLPHIKQLLSHEDHPTVSNSFRILENLAQEQNFTFEFIQFPSMNTDSIMLLLELRVIPVSVFHGYGKTFDEARDQAANSALIYIRNVSRQHHSSSTLVTSPLTNGST